MLRRPDGGGYSGRARQGNQTLGHFEALRPAFGLAKVVDDSSITQNSGGGIYICVEGQVAPQPVPQLPCHGTLALKNTSVTENAPDDIFP